MPLNRRWQIEPMTDFYTSTTLHVTGIWTAFNGSRLLYCTICNFKFLVTTKNNSVGECASLGRSGDNTKVFCNSELQYTPVPTKLLFSLHHSSSRLGIAIGTYRITSSKAMAKGEKLPFCSTSLFNEIASTTNSASPLSPNESPR